MQLLKQKRDLIKVGYNGAKMVFSRRGKHDSAPTEFSQRDVPDILSKTRSRKCNICKLEFAPESRFERYCDTCRDESEMYHYSDWLDYAG